MKIAFTGIAGSGKDFLVNYLVQEQGFTRVSFSDQLKKLSKIIYPWMEQDYPPYEKEQPLNITLSSGELITKTPREIWLHLNLLRQIEDGLFLRMLQEDIDSLDTDKIVISDIRPKIEWDWCKNNNFTTIYINPTKQIYEPNDFDKQVLLYKGQADLIFNNNFNGLDEFEILLKNEGII